MLTALGCDVDIAHTGDVALLMVARNNYRLILMDLGLPDMDGLDVAKQIRDVNPALPIYALTAHSDKQLQEKCHEIGMSGFICKPLSKDKCRELLEIYAST